MTPSESWLRANVGSFGKRRAHSKALSGALGVSSVAALLLREPASGRPALTIGVVGALCLLAAGTGWVRSRQERGFPDWFAPAVFPSIYSTISFLLPLWLVFVDRQVLLGFGESSMHPETVALVTSGLLALQAGLLWPWKSTRPEPAKQSHGINHDTLFLFGRILLGACFAIAFTALVNGAVISRGVDQTTYTPTSFFNTFTRIAAPIGVYILALAQQLKNPGLISVRRTLHPADWALVGLFVTVAAFNGSRSTATIIAVLLFFVITRHRPAVGFVLVGALVMLVLAAGVQQYRADAKGEAYDRSVVHAVGMDWSVVTYTTGVTASHIPSTERYLFGSTYGYGLLAQVPRPLTHIVGMDPAEHSGTRAFRDLAGIRNENQGFAFSIPAEGYLNFGNPGLLASCLLYGLIVSWAGSRAKWPSVSVKQALFPLLIMVLPVALRSDIVGVIKGTLYPAAILAAALACSGAYIQTQTRSEP